MTSKKGKILAFDYGTKRTGIAETDELQIIASGLETVQTFKIWDYLKNFIDKNSVVELVVGDPGEETDNYESANKFALELSEKYPNIPVYRQDERYTSAMAKQAMIQGGVKKKKRREKGLVDKISAVLILQAYLEQKEFHDS